MIFPKLYHQRNHNQNREDFSFSRPCPWAYFLNGPNATASIAPTLIRHWRQCYIFLAMILDPLVCRNPCTGTARDSPATLYIYVFWRHKSWWDSNAVIRSAKCACDFGQINSLYLVNDRIKMHSFCIKANRKLHMVYRNRMAMDLLSTTLSDSSHLKSSLFYVMSLPSLLWNGWSYRVFKFCTHTGMSYRLGIWWQTATKLAWLGLRDQFSNMTTSLLLSWFFNLKRAKYVKFDLQTKDDDCY